MNAVATLAALAVAIGSTGCLEGREGAVVGDAAADTSEADTSGDDTTVADTAVTDIAVTDTTGVSAPRACSREGLSSVSKAVAAVEGAEVKVAIMAATGDYLVCDADDSGDCVSAINLWDESGSLHAASTTEERFGCYGNPFGQVPAPCEPLYEGRDYYVWGTVVSGFPDTVGGARSPFAEVAVDPVPPVLVVTGFCRQPTRMGLIGRYTGEIVIAPLPTERRLPITVHITEVDGGGYAIDVGTLETATRVNVPLDVRDGGLEFVADLTSLAAMHFGGELVVTLQADRNGFVSVAGSLDGQPATVHFAQDNPWL